MLNFNQVRVFYHVAKNVSYTAAARELCITQPAVTAQIKAFEEHCNLKLFKKRGRSIHLTDEGKTLYRHVRKIFEYEKEIENVIDDMHELKQGILRLGTTKVYARYFMPFLLSHFHGAYPDIKIYLDEGSSLDMIHGLLNFSSDVAIIAKAQDHPDVCFIPFSKEEMKLIVSPRHPLAGKPKCAFKDLAGEPIIMKEIGSGTRKLINEVFDRHNMKPNILMETSNTEFIKELVQRGDGISFLVLQAVTNEIKEGKLATVPIKDERLFLDVSIAYIKDQPLSPSAAAFLETLGKLTAGKEPITGLDALLSSRGTRE